MGEFVKRFKALLRGEAMMVAEMGLSNPTLDAWDEQGESTWARLSALENETRRVRLQLRPMSETLPPRLPMPPRRPLRPYRVERPVPRRRRAAI